MQYIKIFVKIAASVGLLFLLFRKVNFSLAGSWLFSLAGMEAVLIATFFFVVQSIIAGYRTKIVMRIFEEKCSVLTGFRIWVTGLFFGQTLISFVAGDAVRIWQLTKLCIPVHKATLSIVFDRVVGSMVLILMFLTVFPFVFGVVSNSMMKNGLIGLLVVSVGILFVFFSFGLIKLNRNQSKWILKIFELASVSRYLWKSKELTIKVVFFSFVMHALNVIVLFAAIRVLDMNIDFIWCWIFAQPIMLLTLMPISFAGWGVRESAMIVGFGLLGFPEDKILAVSFAFGIGLMISSLPGVIFFMLDRKNTNVVMDGNILIEESLVK